MQGGRQAFSCNGPAVPFLQVRGAQPRARPKECRPRLFILYEVYYETTDPQNIQYPAVLPLYQGLSGKVPAGGGHGGHRRGGKLHDAPGHPGHGGLGHQRHPLQPARLSGGVDRIFGRAGDAAPAHCAVRGGQPGVCRHCRALQLLFPHEPGQGLRGHRGPGAGHPVRPHSAPALRLAQLPPDGGHHPALHPGRGPDPQLCQRPADGSGAHRALNPGLSGADVRHERGALPAGHRLCAGGDGLLPGLLRHHREEVPPGRRDRGRADRPGAGEPDRRAGGAGLWPGAL